MNKPRVINGHGAFRITVQGGGIVMFECWDMDEDGNVKAYFHAGSTKEET